MIALDITGENKDLLAKLAQAEKRVDTLEDKLRGAGRKSGDAWSAAGNEIAKIATGLIGPMGISVAVLKLVSTVKDAYTAMLQEHRRFLANIEGTADAKARFLYNAVQLPGGKDAAEAMARDVAGRSGATMPVVYDILATAFSAGGGASPDTMRSAAVQAATMQRLGLGQGVELVGGILDLAQTTGSGDARANTAFMRQIGAASRAVSLRAQLNLLPGVKAGVMAGDSPEAAGEFVAAMNAAMMDPEGNLSGTAAVNVFNRLRQEALVPTGGGRFRKAQGGTTAERLADLQDVFAGAAEADRDAILKRIGGEAKARPVIEAMLRNTADWQGNLADKQSKITAVGSPEAMAMMDRFDRDMGTGSEGLVGTVRQARAATERDATLDRDLEAASVAVRDEAMAWIKQQGMLGQFAHKAYLLQDSWNSFTPPEGYRNLAYNVTPADRRNSEEFRSFMEHLDTLVATVVAKTMEKAYEGLNRATESFDTAARVMTETTTASRSNTVRQELD